MKEIGSEYWLNNQADDALDIRIPSWLNLGTDSKLLLSGRTAIDFVLKDIQKYRKINTVYFPSYCCQSMMQPFIDNDVDIIFYDVHFEEEFIFNIDTTKECDIFFAVNYFGFAKGRIDRYIEEFKQRNIIVIEDSTHSFLSNKSFNVRSDYIVASLRKWFPVISGGLAVKSLGRFDILPKEETLDEMVEIRKVAMLEKAKYISNQRSVKKSEFIQKYSMANQILNKEYSLYSIDRESYRIILTLDLDSLIRRRKENAKTIYDKLPLVKGKYKLVFSELESGDCPIFIPIIFHSNTERNTLRGHLINSNVYCPVHWPKPTILNEQQTTSLYDNGLSLVADQRYDDTDMEYLIRRLEEFYE
ncbi:hypothetical protein [Bacillus sp. E214]|uniref:hypothetical protein n=1 Tax=Bacillus sp. E214 TaxID=2587156 RepID=UPI0011DFDB44|nr:hypothetical protein [Bacillus sp. E214]